MTIVHRFEPTVEGLKPHEQTRRVTAFDCILSKEPLDESDPGYQAPKPPEEPSQNIKEKSEKPKKVHQKKQYNQEGSSRPEKAEEDKPDTHDKKTRGQRGGNARFGKP